MSSISSFNMSSSQPSRKGKHFKKRDNTCHRYIKQNRGREANSEDDIASIYTSITEMSPLKKAASAPIQYDKKLSEALENAANQSLQIRTEALQCICDILMHRHIPDAVKENKSALVKCIQKSLKSGKKEEEQSLAAHMIPLVAMQTGSAGSIANEFNNLLQTIIENKSFSLAIRIKCIRVLGIVNFMGEEDIKSLIYLMRFLENIFSRSFLNGEGKNPKVLEADAHKFHMEALKSWALLLTKIPSDNFATRRRSPNSIVPTTPNLVGLLKSQHLNVRTTTGEILALVFEWGRTANKDFFEDENLDCIIAYAEEMSNDADRYHARRDRKVQKTMFRDIFQFLKDNIPPSVNIGFGKENLVLNSWANLHQYNQLCSIMGPGITTHLENNSMVRKIFKLGPKRSDDESSIGISTHELHLKRAAAFKERTKSLRELRDKRAVIVA